MSTEQQDWIVALAELKARQQPCALVTVIGVVGSAPREVGARMIVSLAGLEQGTVGGGRLEFVAKEHAQGLLRAGRVARETLVLPLAERVGQCCGGEVTLLVETFTWERPLVAVFGAGHVGQALGGLAPWMGAKVLLIDNRAEESLEPRPKVDRPYEILFSNAPEAELAALPDSAVVLVMTHDHALDQELVAAALLRPFPYLGLIGSERKWKRFAARLTQRGFSPEALERVTCPIGGRQTSKEPGRIALAAAAEVALALGRVRP